MSKDYFHVEGNTFIGLLSNIKRKKEDGVFIKKATLTMDADCINPEINETVKLTKSNGVDVYRVIKIDIQAQNKEYKQFNIKLRPIIKNSHNHKGLSIRLTKINIRYDETFGPIEEFTAKYKLNLYAKVKDIPNIGETIPVEGNNFMITFISEPKNNKGKIAGRRWIRAN